MADETVVIQLVLDDKDAKRVINSLPDKFQKSGKKAGNSFSKGLEAGLKNLAGVAIKAGAALGAIVTGASVAAAARQEQAINNLNASLARIGEFSQQTSQDLQNFASQLQSVTKFGDEAVLEQLSFAQSLGATADQSKQVVTAAADLAAALNIDLNSATRNVAKTLGGFAGELGEVIPELKGLTQEQLRAGAGVDLLAAKFAGFAQQDVKTTLGALTQIKNLFGDLLEEIGAFATQSVFAGRALGFIRDALIQSIKSLNAFRTSFNLSDIVNNLIQFAEANQTLVLKPLVKTFQTVEFLFKSFKTGLNLLVGGIFQSIGLVGDALSALGVDDTLVATLQGFNEKAAEQFQDFEQNAISAGASLDSLFGEESIIKFEEFKQTAIPIFEELNEKTATFALNFEGAANKVSGATKKISDGARNAAKAVNAAIGQAIVKTASAGIQALTKSLFLGEEGFRNFGKAIAGILGDLSIQLGETLILSGLGVEALKSLGGTAAIAAGAGLVALGTILKSFSGGGGGASAPSGTTPAGGIFTPDTVADTPVEVREPDTQINVNIQGDVLDSEETGLRVVEIINNAYDKEGVVINRGAIA